MTLKCHSLHMQLLYFSYIYHTFRFSLDIETQWKVSVLCNVAGMMSKWLSTGYFSIFAARCGSTQKWGQHMRQRVHSNPLTWTPKSKPRYSAAVSILQTNRAAVAVTQQTGSLCEYTCMFFPSRAATTAVMHTPHIQAAYSVRSARCKQPERRTMRQN